MNESRNSVAGTMSVVAVSQAVSLVVNLALAVVLSRWLEPAGRGAFVLANLIAQTVTIVLAFGLPVSGTTFMLRRDYPVQRVFSNALTLSLARSVLSGLVVGLVWLVWSKFRALGLPVFFLVWGICAIETLYLLARGLLFSTGQVGRWALTDIGVNFMLVLLAAGSWLAGQPGAASYALLLYVAARLAGIVYALHAGRKFARFRPGFDREMFTALFRFGFRNFLSDVVWTFGPRMDMYVVGGALSTASLGIYSIATGLADRMTTVMLTIPTGLYRFQATAENDDRRVERLTLRALRLSLAAGVLMSFAMVLLARFAIPLLFGSEYSSAALPLGILTIGATLGISFHIFRGFLTGYRMKPEISAVFGLALVVACTAANVLLVPRFGIVGAAFASLAGTLAVFLPFAGYFRRASGATWTEMLVLNRDDLLVVRRAIRGLTERIAQGAGPGPRTPDPKPETLRSGPEARVPDLRLRASLPDNGV
jgi:O-antigen/teichoic acid export membrane protein